MTFSVTDALIKPCPLCHSSCTNVARDLGGCPKQAFCKACGCSAPIDKWQAERLVAAITRPSDRRLFDELLMWLDGMTRSADRAAANDAELWQKRIRAMLSASSFNVQLDA
jgi:hypothetical protein